MKAPTTSGWRALASTYLISDLHVVNWAKESGTDGPWPERGLRLDTCLRRLCVHLGGTQRFRGAEHYHGIDAYQFLLEVTTGLRSKVPGETNVFGQFRAALDEFRRNGHGEYVTELAPVMQRVIEDTRTIRRDHLHDIGGASYGRLVRKLIQPAANDRILFVGAGNLAQSMLPFFGNFTVGLWNRRRPARNVSVARLFGADERDAAARWARHVILTTPPDPRHDRVWQRALAGPDLCTTLHLGHRRARHEPWPVAQRFFDLDDVFELRARLNDFSSLQLERARAACRSAAVSLDTYAVGTMQAQAGRA